MSEDNVDDNFLSGKSALIENEDNDSEKLHTVVSEAQGQDIDADCPNLAPWSDDENYLYVTAVILPLYALRHTGGNHTKDLA